MAKGPEYYKNLARNIAAQEFPGDPHSQSVYMQQIRQESHFNPSARSGAGAQGIAQFMPATARGYHINPMNPTQALHAAAQMDKANLRKYGNWNDTLSLYNSGKGWAQGQHIGETNDYVHKIIGLSSKTGMLNPAASKQVGQAVLSTPDPSKRQALVSALLAANEEFVKTGKVGAFTIPPGMGQRAAQRVQSRGSGPVPTGPKAFGKVILPAGVDRAGVRTNPKILHFAGRVAGVYGAPVTVGTGTRHSRMTADGNVSDHWSGNAVDIPAGGAQLIRMGQSALIAAGMSPKQARRQRGGLYNVGGHQVIFNTNQGGDHTNHLHISAR